MMRKDPPFDMEYIYTTYLLERAEAEGVMVINRPASLRDCNEKLFASAFPQCCPPLVVATAWMCLSLSRHKCGLQTRRHGRGFNLPRHESNPNLSVVLDPTNSGREQIIGQIYLPEIVDDKRILIVNGEPVPMPSREFRQPAKLEAI